MTRKVFFLSLVVCLFAMTACQSGKRCKGGGWYGNRNLTSIDKQNENKVDVKTIKEDCEIVCEP